MKCLLLCWILGGSGWAGQLIRIDLSSQPAQVGQPFLIRAAVSDPAAGRSVAQGTISFTVDGTAIPKCEAQWVWMSSGAAECWTSFPKVAAYRVVATFSGTSEYDGGSASLDIAVGKLYAKSFLASFPPKPVYGGTLEVNALMMGVDSPKPGGTFTFFEGGKEIVTRAVEPAKLGGVAGMATPLPVGRHTITGLYNGDDSYKTSIPIPVEVTVDKGPPGLYIAATPAQLEQPVTINVLVLPDGAAGTVTFTGAPGCAAAEVRGGYASCTTVFHSLGTVTVRADYSGDANLLPASTSMKLTVGRVVAGVFVAFTPAAPVYGQPLLVGALALGAPGVAPPTGAVTFSDNLAASGVGVLSADGHAQWTVQPAAGLRTFTATYNGDANYGTSQGVGSITIAKAATAVAVSSTDGRMVTAIVTAVAPGSGTPTGNVGFVRDGVTIGTAVLAPVAGGAAATFDAAGKNGNIRAEYAGDLNFLASVSAAAAVNAPAVDLRLRSDRNPAPAGNVTFIAAAVPNPGTAIPTGSVQVTVDGAAAGSAPLSQGTATVTLELKSGSHAVAAAYSGDAAYPPATASMTQMVTAPAGTIALTANPQSPVYGQPVTFTAQLPAGSSGKVDFADGAVPLGTTDGVLTVSRLAAGAHAITASWAGDTAWSGSTAQLALAVAKAQTSTTLMVSGGIAAARVSAIAPGAGTPSGSIRFADGAGQGFAVVPLDGGTASTALPPGVSLVTALYEGDANFAASASSAAGLLTVVNAASYSTAGFAPGEIVTVFGSNLAGGAQVIDSAGAKFGVDLLYATDSQASLVLPDGLADGAGTLTTAGMTAALPIGRTAPGLFTLDASGHGTPAGQVVRVRADGSQETAPADVVDLDGGATYLVLYGTGIRRYRDRVVCAIGGRAVPVVFAGPQGGTPGVDQVNVLLPPELKGVGRAEVVVTADGVASNAVTLVFR